MNKIFILFIFLFFFSKLHSQDEFIYRSTKEVTTMNLRIIKVSEDSLYYQTFSHQKSIALNEIIGYRYNYKINTQYFIPNPNDAGYFKIDSTQLEIKRKLPNSIVNMGIGFGLNYGTIGAKTVIGYKNSGLLVSYGSFLGIRPSYLIGGQLSVGFISVSVGYGSIALLESSKGNLMLYGIVGSIGPMICLGKNKRIFLDLSLQYKDITDNIDDKLESDINSSWGASMGVSYRLGGNSY